MVESDHVTWILDSDWLIPSDAGLHPGSILITSRRPNPDTRTCKRPEYENTGPGIIADTIIAIILTTLNVRCELGLMRPLLMVMLTDTPRRLDRENKTETDRQ